MRHKLRGVPQRSSGGGQLPLRSSWGGSYPWDPHGGEVTPEILKFVLLSRNSICREVRLSAYSLIFECSMGCCSQRHSPEEKRARKLTSILTLGPFIVDHSSKTSTYSNSLTTHKNRGLAPASGRSASRGMAPPRGCISCKSLWRHPESKFAGASLRPRLKIDGIYEKSKHFQFCNKLLSCVS